MPTETKIELTERVERLSSELQQAQADLALLKRLQGAKAEVERLSHELRAAQEQLATSTASEIETRRRERLASFQRISVSESGAHDGLLHCRFDIEVTRLQWDGHESVPSTQVYHGFEGLPRDALEHLIEQHAELIPSSIAALAPGKPWDAFSRYFVARRRGYFTGAVAA
jgi:hypothetical protein